MPKVLRSARVEHSARQMFDLVNDIENYPRFLDWCTGARVEGSDADEMTASIEIGIAGIGQRFTTRNRLTPPEAGAPGRISMHLVDGPFRRLDGEWQFEPQPDGGCEVRLELDYELSFSPLRFVLATVFEEIARSQVSAFVRRARSVYGDT